MPKFAIFFGDLIVLEGWETKQCKLWKRNNLISYIFERNFIGKLIISHCLMFARECLYVISIQHIKHFCSNPFSINIPLLYPPETSENLWFSDVFRRYISKALVENGLIFIRAYILFQLTDFMPLLSLCTPWKQKHVVSWCFQGS